LIRSTTTQNAIEKQGLPFPADLVFFALFLFLQIIVGVSLFFLSYVIFVSDGLLYEKIEVHGSRTQIITL
jgi:hypothetical protein